MRPPGDLEVQKVLVVDDEPGIRSFIAEVLDGEGLAVTTARMARKAGHCLIGRVST
jgi:CheY-like chemotaxis protein